MNLYDVYFFLDNQADAGKKLGLRPAQMSAALDPARIEEVDENTKSSINGFLRYRDGMPMGGWKSAGGRLHEDGTTRKANTALSRPRPKKKRPKEQVKRSNPSEPRKASSSVPFAACKSIERLAGTRGSGALRRSSSGSNNSKRQKRLPLNLIQYAFYGEESSDDDEEFAQPREIGATPEPIGARRFHSIKDYAMGAVEDDVESEGRPFSTGPEYDQASSVLVSPEPHAADRNDPLWPFLAGLGLDKQIGGEKSATVDNMVRLA